MESSKEHLIPPIVKNIAEKMDPKNVHATDDERFFARGQLEAIIQFCKEAIELGDKPKVYPDYYKKRKAGHFFRDF